MVLDLATFVMADAVHATSLSNAMLHSMGAWRFESPTFPPSVTKSSSMSANGSACPVPAHGSQWHLGSARPEFRVESMDEAGSCVTNKESVMDGQRHWIASRRHVDTCENTQAEVTNNIENNQASIFSRDCCLGLRRPWFPALVSID